MPETGPHWRNAPLLPPLLHSWWAYALNTVQASEEDTQAEQPLSTEAIQLLGHDVIKMLSVSQLRACHVHYATELNDQMVVPMKHVRQVLANHWRRCVKMPAGGAHAGGSMQTGFEVELIPSRGGMVHARVAKNVTLFA